MSLQQPPPQARSSANGYGRRSGTRSENKMKTGKLNQKRSMNSGAGSGYRVGKYETSSRDRLVYLTTCLIGHCVEVQVKNGSIYSGIFHATNAEEELGIILKMACLIKDETLRGQKESASRANFKTLIIPGNELVQIIAKDASVYADGLGNEIQGDRQQEILIDSVISQSRHVEVERELEPWIPDEDAPPCPELENVFDSPWNRNWDQFETNKTLFGVESTFDEELYTTKLEKGPQMRYIELEAMRIAREIEGEDTKDLHLAEERGIQLQEDIDIDEETKFSSVYRGRMPDDSGYEEEEDIMLNSSNNETFGVPSGSILSRSLADFSCRSSDGAQASTSSSFVNEGLFTQSSGSMDTWGLGTDDHPGRSGSSLSDKSFPSSDENRISDTYLREQHRENMSSKEAKKAVMTSSDAKEYKFKGVKYGSDKVGQFFNASYVPEKCQEKTTPSIEYSVSGKNKGEPQSLNFCGQPDSSTSSTSDSAVVISASSGPRLSPSSSVGSLSSEKSTLNPHAKEFKLNPNAKSFKPLQIPLRPPSPVSDASYYYPNVSDVPHMHGMPVGMGPSFAGHQPVMYNPQVAQVSSAQAYFHPNGPQYGQQMFVGAPRQMMYMPGYPPGMPYRGRDF